MPTSYMKQLIENRQFWFLKESALELWLSQKDPKALSYLAIAYFCLGQAPVGMHWLQQGLKKLSHSEQKAMMAFVCHTLPPTQAPEIVTDLKRIRPTLF